MGMNYEIVRYDPDLKAEIIKLQTRLWGPDLILNASYFEWKYERNPYLRELLIYLAMDNDKPIGMRGFFGVQWQCGMPVQRFQWSLRRRHGDRTRASTSRADVQDHDNRI